jgi:eukaryotic-like serine/threonine-protein kinase
VPSPRAINPLLPPSLENIIMHALAKKREGRFQTMEEFAEALMDPERFAASPSSYAPTQPIPTPPPVLTEQLGATPDGRADSVVSGRVVFGQLTPGPGLGAQSAPMPSTFRHAKGELTDNDDEMYRVVKPRRTGKILGLLGVVAAAGLAAYYYVGQEAPQPAPAPVVAQQPPEPPAAKKVRLTVKSDPVGAKVLRKDTSEQLGITPFDIELPAGKVPIELLFRKEAYRDKVDSFVPEESGQIAVALVASPPPEPRPTAEPARPAESASAAKPAGKAAAAGKPASAPRHRSPGSRRTPRSLDEDGVLAPSF